MFQRGWSSLIHVSIFTIHTLLSSFSFYMSPVQYGIFHIQYQYCFDDDLNMRSVLRIWWAQSSRITCSALTSCFSLWSQIPHCRSQTDCPLPHPRSTSARGPSSSPPNLLFHCVLLPRGQTYFVSVILWYCSETCFLSPWMNSCILLYHLCNKQK